ncbi:response regulator [Cellulosimicrobium marinum]|uniref:response regulator n=1 Tax=Cellulosimicrobium marinum TaxID=1638992 RepID=UPI001E5CF696|nr:response regulator transcription factor [Cellulosimicrobium marinum]MCB7135961.1 response regulator transcription factor [Cellulosimicrobium marinum]
MSEPVRVVLADDHPLYRDGLAGLLGTTDDLVVVGTAEDGAGAVALAEELTPDVVVLDLKMPVLDGVEAARRIVAAAPHTAVLVLTMFDDDALVFRAMRAGARGYVLKAADPVAVLAAVRAVARGEAVFSPDLASRLRDWFAAAPVDLGPFARLTPRERDVLDLLARGLGNPAIGERLGISAKTVRNVVSNVLVKLQVADRAGAVARARDAGLGSS